MENIQIWLDSGADYKKGILIYESLRSHSRILLKVLKTRETPINREKLIYELKKSLPTKSTALPTKVTTSPKNIPAEKESKRIAPLFHELPKELRPVLLEANNLYRENCLLKVQLNECEDDDEEKALGIMILIDKNFKANEMCWNKIDYWRNNKILPEIKVADSKEKSMDELLKQQQLVHSSKSRLEKRLLENRDLIDSSDSVKERNRLERLVLKQEKRILEQKEVLLNIKNQIDVKTAGN